MNTLIRKMEDHIRQYPEVRQFSTTIENGQRANIRVLFEEKYQSGSFPYLLKNKLIGKALELEGGSWSIYGMGDGFSNDVKESAGPYQIKIFGYNYEQLTVLAAFVLLTGLSVNSNIYILNEYNNLRKYRRHRNPNRPMCLILQAPALVQKRTAHNTNNDAIFVFIVKMCLSYLFILTFCYI